MVFCGLWNMMEKWEGEGIMVGWGGGVFKVLMFSLIGWSLLGV